MSEHFRCDEGSRRSDAMKLTILDRKPHVRKMSLNDASSTVQSFYRAGARATPLRAGCSAW